MLDRILKVGLGSLVGSVALLAIFLLIAPAAGAEDVTWGDRTVSGAEAYADTNITLDGNLTILSGGNLELN
ncbi:MAG: hypothetical protein GWN18_18665, partial [Thermoplasmata archaeon]|nr:hypothetical protein [Thermoplasmata archaeon]NIS14152.1 hypothetical protein [Thermoplasmata archaeon]NIS21991.1 hypothetical protein [Thermoplasmata archaeon]NIT79850.1 hypothetical protein [Thermoplasmata archaeon]NIU51016.1 hypothetical protein [Thermoplasmata archaeon]